MTFKKSFAGIEVLVLSPGKQFKINVFTSRILAVKDSLVGYLSLTMSETCCIIPPLCSVFSINPCIASKTLDDRTGRGQGGSLIASIVEIRDQIVNSITSYR